MPYILCEFCENEFYSKPSWIKNSKGKYCSIKCSSENRKLGKIIRCHICRKRTYKQKKAINGSKSGNLFCSKSCSLEWKNKTFIGHRHNNWINGGNSKSYRNIISRSKISKKCSLCGNDDIRILDVHHKDGNRKNNLLRNLIWLCCNCHFLVHRYNLEHKKMEKYATH